jgi:3-hydroxyacyl-[acyl-carrier-protein] dehydratase
MRFCQLDRIVQLERGRRIVAVKGLSLAESYLADHFPRFPIMPGVLMLEAMYQASMWLLLVSEDFAAPSVSLVEANNIRFAGFVQPGAQLVVTAEVQRNTPDGVLFKVRGDIAEHIAVRGQLELRRVKFEDQPFGCCEDDEFQRQRLRGELRRLIDPQSPLADLVAEVNTEIPNP